MIGFIFYEIKYKLFLYVYINYKIIDIFIVNLIYVYVMLLYDVMCYYNNNNFIIKYFYIKLFIKLDILYFICLFIVF